MQTAIFALLVLCAACVVASFAAGRISRIRGDRDAKGSGGSLAHRRGKRLAETMRLLSMAEEIADLGIWQYYPRQGRQEWSAGMKGLFGLDAEDELLEGDADTLFAATEIDLVDEVMTRKGRRGVFGLRICIRRLDGCERDIRVRACHIDSDKPDSHRVIGVLLDVTDHARRERRLKESREIALREAKRARELAETDALTGLANRRRVMAELDRLVMLMRSKSQPLSLIIFDVDHFKKVNDTHGHAVGDQVLQQISMVALEQVRAGDLLGRIGGEEFVWIVPGADTSFVKLAAERLRLAIALGSAVDNVPASTISIGVASAGRYDTALSLFARADAALYDAKHAGRNTVRLAA